MHTKVKTDYMCFNFLKDFHCLPCFPFQTTDTLTQLYSGFGSVDHDRTTETPPLQQKPHPPLRNPLLIGVILTTQSTATATAISNTWGKHAQNLIYFTSSDKDKGEELLTGSGRHVITLPSNHDNDLKPHSSGAYHALKILHDRYVKEYEWFLLVDDKTYVRTKQLNSLVNRVDPNSEQCISSRKDFMWCESDSEEQKSHGLGGLGTIFSQAMLKKLAPHLDKCLMNVTSSSEKRGEDDVGRCLQERTTGLQCTRYNEVCCMFNSMREVCVCVCVCERYIHIHACCTHLATPLAMLTVMITAKTEHGSSWPLSN